MGAGGPVHGFECRFLHLPLFHIEVDVAAYTHTHASSELRVLHGRLTHTHVDRVGVYTTWTNSFHLFATTLLATFYLPDLWQTLSKDSI